MTSAPDGQNDVLAVGSSGSRPRWLRFDALAILFLIALSFFFVVSKAPANTEFSPFDEYVYADYLDKIPSQLIVRAGDETGEAARNELSCRGVRYYETVGEECNEGTHNRDDLYPYEGTTAADIYAPVYFATTWALSQPLVAAGVGLVDSGRLVGVVWLALGMWLLFVLLRRLRVDGVLALASCLLVFAAPVTYWNTTYLSTDAPTLALSAGIGLLAVEAIRGRRSVWWLVPVAILAVLTKVQNLGSVALVALAILIASVHPSLGRCDATSVAKAEGVKSRRRPLAVAAIVIVASALAAQVVWLAVRSRLRAPDFVPTPIDFNNPDLSAATVVDEVFRFITHVGDAGVDPGVAGVATINVLSLMCIAGILGLALSSADSGIGPARRWLLGVPTLVTVLIFGPLLAVGSQLVAGYYFALPYRYGIVLLPFLVCCAAVYFTRVRWLRYPALVLGAGLAGATFL